VNQALRASSNLGPKAGSEEGDPKRISAQAQTFHGASPASQRSLSSTASL
jgi:hypothetical protein